MVTGNSSGNHTGESHDDRAINNHSTLGNLQQNITTIWLSRLIPNLRSSYLFLSKQQIDLPSSSLPETKASYPLSQTLAAK